MHEGGKIEQLNKHPLKNRDDLSMAYTPGVARVCRAIHEDPELAFRYTLKRNYVAVVSDGSAVLGLGDIGPRAAMPVMEGKAMLLKEFGGVDAFPICLDTKDPDEIVATVKAIAPGFGGINLEDISSPRCFEIEDRLKEELDIPVFHDDQHGTAVVVMAALFNGLKITGKRLEDLHVAMVGLGAAGIAVTRMLLQVGVREIIGCDTHGAIYVGRDDWDEMHPLKRWYAEQTNSERRSGGPGDVVDGADLFIGLSGPGVIEAHELSRMNDDAMVFAMANPEPEVMPEEAAQYARIVATGRSDYPNQINNVLCFPGLVPRRAGRPRRGDHRGDEAGGRVRDRRGDLPLGAVRGLHHPERVRPPGGGGRRGGGRRTRPAAPASRARARCSRRPHPRASARQPAPERRSAGRLAARLAARAAAPRTPAARCARGSRRSAPATCRRCRRSRSGPTTLLKFVVSNSSSTTLLALGGPVAGAVERVEHQRHRRVPVRGQRVRPLAELTGVVAHEAAPGGRQLTRVLRDRGDVGAPLGIPEPLVERRHEQVL